MPTPARKTPARQADPEWISLVEAAALLGVCKTKAWYMARGGEFTLMETPGRRGLRVLRSDITGRLEASIIPKRVTAHA